MTGHREALREEVARALAREQGWTDLDWRLNASSLRAMFLVDADAVLAVVQGEAGAAEQRGRKHAADAIRTLHAPGYVAGYPYCLGCDGGGIAGPDDQDYGTDWPCRSIALADQLDPPAPADADAHQPRTGAH